MAPSIRLELQTLEPAVFLRPPTPSEQPGPSDGGGQVRALLTLHCARAIKIRTIRLSFVGTSHSIWPDTSAPRAPVLDLEYDHVLFSTTAVLFDARDVPRESRPRPRRSDLSERPRPEREREEESTFEKGLRRLSIRPSRSKSTSRQPQAGAPASAESTVASTPAGDTPEEEDYFAPIQAPPSYTYDPPSEFPTSRPVNPPRSRAGSLVRFDPRAGSPPLSPRLSTSKSFGGILRALDKEKDELDSRTFKPGVYELPINISLPSGLPPTLSTGTGWNKYVLKATAERTGALTPNLTTEREVTLVQSYDEVLDPIVVQRTWEESLTYMAVISGRSFAIGSPIPLWIKFVPQAKVAVVRLSAALEERVSYHKPQACRHEVPQRWSLLKLQGEGGRTLFPSDSIQAVEKYLYPDLSDEVVARTLDPLGPWEVAFSLPIPQGEVNMSCTHKESSLRVTHALRLTFRVKRLDEDKMFDIVIEAPIILSHSLTADDCASLPNYAHASAAGLSTSQRDTVDRWLALGQSDGLPPPPPYPADISTRPVVSDEEHWD